MPGYDRKGPRGEGPRTGGGFGLCNPRSKRPDVGDSADYEYPMRGAGRGFAPWGGGRGHVFGGGRGAGFQGGGRRRGFGQGLASGYRGFPRMADYVGPWGRSNYSSVPNDQTAPQNELEYLRGMMGDMEKEMKALQKRIRELEAKPKE
jgi:hypothetical protein